MPLGIVKTGSSAAKAALAVVGIAACAGCYFASKWHLAGAAAPRADSVDLASVLVSLAPDDPQTHFALAVLKDKTFERAEAEAALAEYREAVRLAPQNYLAWLELAKALERNDERTEAEKAFERTRELAPNYADVKWAYGNFILRSGGRDDEAFRLMADAVAARASLAGPAVVTAMQAAEGDAARARAFLGDTPVVNAALSAYLLSQKRFDEAGDAWRRLPAEQKRTELLEQGRNLAFQAAGERRYRLAAEVLSDLGTEPMPAIAAVTNGGFEGLRLKPAHTFDWQIAPGEMPQISLSDRAHGGASSLRLSFETHRASDFRPVEQLVAVAPGAGYRLDLFYRSELRTSVSLHFEVLDAASGKEIARSSSLALNTEWASLSAVFTAPVDSDGVVIRLVRDKCESSICPINGKVWIDDVTLSQQ